MKKHKIFGMGINDIPKSSHTRCYTTWHSMIRRAYSENYQRSKPSYVKVKVCNDWLFLSNFSTWFNDNYVEGWELDKDILAPFEYLYSPETCCFVPPEINSALIHRETKTNLPLGVYYKKNLRRYIAQLSKSNKEGRKSIHLGCFETPEEAFKAYKENKEDYLKELATNWKNKLNPKVYEALINYEVVDGKGLT